MAQMTDNDKGRELRENIRTDNLFKAKPTSLF
jgi:hypothetical protein